MYCFEENDEMQFVFNERVEPGFKNIMQLAPTHQCHYFPGENELSVNGECILSFNQSEEGGRFYHNISEYKICKVSSSEVGNIKGEHRALNLHQICQLLKFEGIFTNEARSLIAGIVKFIE